jgi:glycosyltransferase involved in cell wall biosynthesis
MIESQRKNVLLVSSSFNFGGKEKLLVDLAEQFPSFNITPHIAVLSNQSERERRPGEIAFYPPRFTGDWRVPQNIRKTVAQKKIVSVICFDVFSYLNVRLALVGSSIKPRIVTSLHNSDFARRKKEMVHTFLWRALQNRRDKIIAICNYQAAFYAKRFFLNRDRFTVIYNGIKVSEYSGMPGLSSEAVRKKYSLPENKRFILQVGGLRPEKKHEHSIEALSIYRTTYGTGDVALLIVGGGSREREEELRDTVRKFQVEDSVFFLGFQKNVKELFPVSSLFTLSSVEVETFSIAALEAMAYGLPCVLTNVGGAAEMIREGLNGVTVSANDPAALAHGWHSVLHDAYSPARIQENIMQKYTIERCCEQYAKLILQ